MRQLNSALIGPGAYSVDMSGAFPMHKNKKNNLIQKDKQTSFGTANRDTHFSKYAGLHKTLIEKGLF